MGYQLGITIDEVKRFVKSIDVCNYCQGPMSDHDLRNAGDVWVFKKKYQNEDIYIKLRVRDEKNDVICFRCHIDEPR